MTQWTKEQQQVIETREKNMLVSAAAGSGKTAVLVERIISRVLDEKNPVDIDKILVVTFTRAAAAEMRERVLQAINLALEADPDNAYLLRQSTLVHNAFITTIDSFCNDIVRNHFYEIDVDPGFRIGDEGEMKLLESNVLERVMEEQYRQEEGKKNAGFLELVDAYAKGETDEAVKENVLTLYHKAQSFPWPNKWLQSLEKPYQIKDIEELKNTSWFIWLLDLLRQTIKEAQEDTKKLLEYCYKPQGPLCYEKGLKSDLEQYEDILAFEDGVRFYQALGELHYKTIGRKPKGYEGDETLLATVKEKRDQIKKRVEKCKEEFCGCSMEEMVSQMKRLRPMVQEWIALTLEFSRSFSLEKKKKNVLDFNDVEHFALKILKDEDTAETTTTAQELQRQFVEIMIDEYQDSNFIQEEILNAISREKIGEHNLFMVGDVKQSIYRFRQACPEIFMEKYARFKDGEEGCIAIDLQKNFRSRYQVLDFVNAVFYPLMHRDLGGVEYDEAAALYPGASYIEDKGDFSGEIWIADWDKELLCAQDWESKTAYEAKVIADRILDLCKTQYVTDKETKTMRKMRFSDVVILMRSPNKYADEMISVLQENGIPAFAESKTGYFDTVEVKTVLNLLRILDNPYQDIPLAAVLHSPMFGFTNEELAKIHQKKKPLIEALREWKEEGLLAEKCYAFDTFLEEKRNMVSELPIHQLLLLLLEETDYLSYVSAMPRGANRRANLQKLVDEAVCYEKTSYQGLFHFVRYIEQLQQYDVEMGEAVLTSENDDAVAIMSIHKSKGLEFPVVILAGSAKQFNEMDTRGSMILHSQMGMGLDLLDVKEQTKTVTLYKKIVARAMKWEMYGEEMRILYVAMTRAKEKLLVIGTLPEAEEKCARWEETTRPISVATREGAKNYLEWIVRATAENRTMYPLQRVTPKDVVAKQVKTHLTRIYGKKELLSRLCQVDEKVQQRVEQQLNYVYPYFSRQRYKSKYSVSEIKHHTMEEAFSEDTEQKPIFLQREKEPVIPAFIAGKKEEEVSQGALRGSAMHRYLECFDFAAYMGKSSLTKQADKMEAEGRLKSVDKALLSWNKLYHFFESELAQRMIEAEKRQNLYREKPFVMQAEPAELFEEAPKEGDTVLVQGIVDAFFVEDGEIVLLDYKTDRVQRADELIKRYQMQLRLYAQALQRAWNMPVKEIWIYSFALEQIISI